MHSNVKKKLHLDKEQKVYIIVNVSGRLAQLVRVLA